MSAGYRAVQWSPGKRIYDGALALLLALYLGAFLGVSFVARPEITVETALIRAFGTAALLLLHLVLAIGPLARLDRRFLPLLWNRRHLGVTMFSCALAHGALALVQFHAFGERNPLVSLLTSNGRLGGGFAQLPFQPLGALALGILFLMAATSHDFWLTHLTAPIWKALHMGVYLAYGLVISHVALGALEDERAPLLLLLLAVGLGTICTLHLVAGWRERRIDRAVARAEEDGFVEVCRVAEIANRRARIVPLAGERVAIFRYDGKLSAISNVCQHQNGPLGEGKIIDGCVTCPWHGYQYRPEDGASPPPFQERVPTFRVQVVDGRVLVDPRPLPPGTPVAPASIDAAAPEPGDRSDFFVGYLPLPGSLRSFLRAALAVLAAGCAALGAVAAAQQRPLGAGEYAFGVESALDGILRVEPIPAIWRSTGAGDRAGSGGADPIEVVPLVGAGKHGPAAEILALAGRSVHATGTWIQRGPEKLFEIVRAELVEPAPREAGSAGQAEALEVRLGTTTLAGEIVDLKCWLGVMKPGDAKSHKACAILCIEGGTPPGLVVRTRAGDVAVLWLVGKDGRPLGRELLDVVAEPVEVTGELLRLDGRVFLVTDRGRVRRLASEQTGGT